LPVLQKAIFEAGIADKVEVVATTCRNRCDWGPSVNVYPGPVFYADVTPEAIAAIVREHLVGGSPVERFRFREQPTVFQTPGHRR
jgi:(2Fe-2S) ferredoxin